jgi:hypothetical protein
MIQKRREVTKRNKINHDIAFKVSPIKDQSQN